MERFEILHQKYNTEFTDNLLRHSSIFYEIYKACGNNFIHGCGSYLFDGKDYQYCELMYPKQELLYQKVKNATHVLEIGTYNGHSLLIMLMSNPTVRITCIDISDTYSGPAVRVLNQHFNNRVSFIHMDSLNALKALVSSNMRFDFFHIDGDHRNEIISQEFDLCLRLCDDVMRVIFDDQEVMTGLQDVIQRRYDVSEKIIPMCPWSNLYYEIEKRVTQ